MILTLRTDNPEAEIGLYDVSGIQVKYLTWKAHRELAETLHAKIDDLLRTNQKEFSDVTGIIVYEGPGSFTGLRIGCSVANTLANSFNITIVGVTGDDWIQTGISLLKEGHNDRQVLPEYGGQVFTTKPRK